MAGAVACTLQPVASPVASPASTIPPQPTAPAERVTVEPAPTPDVSGVPEAAAPYGLATIAQPQTAEEIRAILERLPDAVAGYARTPQFDQISFDRIIVGYGEERRVNPDGTAQLRLQALDVTTGDFFPPNWRAEHVLNALATQGALERGRDGELYWLLTETAVTPADSAQSFPVYSLTWGEAGGRWLFSASASDPAEVEPLVNAFVAVAQAAANE